MNKLIKQLKSSRSGMTMVEIVVSVSIIALAALLLTSAFGASLNVLNRGVDAQSAGNDAFADIEAGTAGVKQPGQPMEFSAGGKSYKVEGDLLIQEEAVTDDAAVTFYSLEDPKVVDL